MKKFMILIVMLCLPMLANAGDFGVSAGIGSGSLSNTGVPSNSIKSGLAWQAGLTYDFEGNRNYLKLSVINQMTELTVSGGGATVTADMNLWMYDLTGNYYLFAFSDNVNMYGTISVGSAKIELPNIAKSDTKWFVGLGANVRLKVKDNIYIAGVVEYKKVLDDLALLLPTINIEFKF